MSEQTWVKVSSADLETLPDLPIRANLLTQHRTNSSPRTEIARINQLRDTARDLATARAGLLADLAVAADDRLRVEAALTSALDQAAVIRGLAEQLSHAQDQARAALLRASETQSAYKRLEVQLFDGLFSQQEGKPAAKRAPKQVPEFGIPVSVFVDSPAVCAQRRALLLADLAPKQREAVA
jgi:hypothetical protein